MSFINYNGHICMQDEQLVPLQSRALRAGEGLIETMFFRNGKISLLRLHWERLSQGLATLNFPSISIFDFEKELAKTIVANQHPEQGSLRAQFFLNEALRELQFWIEFIPLKEDHTQWKKQGLRTGIAQNVQKNADHISHMKHSSRLLYIMARQEATANDWDDALIRNPAGNIVESTISNVFVLKDNQLFTPPLSEGCVAGVMRRYLLSLPDLAGRKVSEKIMDPKLLASADEIFLTNAVRGIQPVASLEGRQYDSGVTRSIFDLIGTLQA